MSRILILTVVLLCCLVTVAQAGDPREHKPVAVAIDATLPAARATQPVTRMLMTTDRQIFISTTVAITDGGYDASETYARLRARHNNVYALAVNSGNVARATKAVRVNGRVLLRSGSGSGTHLATYSPQK